jgi:hypothetical protein
MNLSLVSCLAMSVPRSIDDFDCLCIVPQKKSDFFVELEMCLETLTECREFLSGVP